MVSNAQCMRAISAAMSISIDRSFVASQTIRVFWMVNEWNEEEEMIGLVMEQQPIKIVWFCLSG